MLISPSESQWGIHNSLKRGSAAVKLLSSHEGFSLYLRPGGHHRESEGSLGAALLPRPSCTVMSVNPAATKSVGHSATVQELNERIRTLSSKGNVQWNNACAWKVRGSTFMRLSEKPNKEITGYVCIHPVFVNWQSVTRADRVDSSAVWTKQTWGSSTKRHPSW